MITNALPVCVFLLKLVLQACQLDHLQTRVLKGGEDQLLAHKGIPLSKSATQILAAEKLDITRGKEFQYVG